jgi:hypothetical protein
VSRCDRCEKCGATGRCEAITDPEELRGRQGCAPSGTACEPTAANLCTTGSCVDGRCCAAASCEVCSSCNVEAREGACQPISGADDDACQGDRSCAQGRCADVDAASTSVGGSFSFGENTNVDRLAQTFVAGRSGRIVQVRAYVLRANMQDGLIASIAEVDAQGVPASALAMLSAESHAKPPLTSSQPDYTAFQPATELRVTAGQKLALVLESPRATGILRAQGGQNTYNEGEVFGMPRTTTTWTTGNDANLPPNIDLAFQVLLEP